jgi:Leucine Rich repeat
MFEGSIPALTSSELQATTCEQVNSTVCSVSVADNGVSNAGIQALSKVVLRSPTLNRLDVSCNNLTHPACSAISRALTSRSCRLTSLRLKNCKLGDKETTELAEALCNNGVLTVLDVSENRISDRGAAAMSRMLSMNASLEVGKLHSTCTLPVAQLMQCFVVAHCLVLWNKTPLRSGPRTIQQLIVFSATKNKRGPGHIQLPRTEMSKQLLLLNSKHQVAIKLKASSTFLYLSWNYCSIINAASIVFT